MAAVRRIGLRFAENKQPPEESGGCLFCVYCNAVQPGVISAAVELDSGSFAPIAFPVPQFHAANVAALAAQINGASLAAGGDALAHLEFVRGAVAVVNNNVLELDGAPANAELNLAESALRFGNLDVVVIRGAIYMRGAEEAPAAIPLALARLWKQEHQDKAEKWNDSCDPHVPPLERCSAYSCGAGL
jgi:hypothetical protein